MDVSPANINRGENHLAEGETADSFASREKVRLSVDEWRIIKTTVEHEYAVRVSLRLKTRVEATSKREDQNT
jgi:hypothetical protein